MQNLSHLTPGQESPLGQAGASAQPSSKAAFVPKQGWILNPVLDYLFVSGGSMWLLYALTLFGISATGSDPQSQFYGAILFWGAFLIGEAHGPATLVRVFESKTTPRHVRVLVALWGVFLIAIAGFTLSNVAYAQTFVKIAVLWAVQHYIAQTFGVIVIYCMKRGYTLAKYERFIVQNLLRSLMWFVLVRMFTYPEYGHVQNFMGIEVPFWGPLPTLCVLVSGYIFVLFSLAFIGSTAVHYVRHKQFFPLPALLAVVTVAAVTLSARNGFYLLAVTFYHASQYLAITFSYYLKEKALAKAAAKKPSTINSDLTAEPPVSPVPKFFSLQAAFYFAVIVGIGYLSSHTLPIYLIKNGLQDTAVLGTVYGLFNCHHYLSDALIWRIRDPQVKKLLV